MNPHEIAITLLNTARGQVEFKQEICSGSWPDAKKSQVMDDVSKMHRRVSAPVDSVLARWTIVSGLKVN